MDIEYLLALQGLRESLGSAVEAFFVGFSFIGDGPALIALTLIVYWCIDKRAGQIAIAAFATGNFINQWVKNLACVYRPWILDARVHPAEAAVPGATGYSFPSGHTTGAVTSLGSLAWSARHRWRWVSVVFVVVILLIAFGRNLLGVHTPQDVLVGAAIGIVMIVAANWFANWMDQNPDRDMIVVVIILVASVICLAVVGLKDYPIAYDAAGQPLVDVETMKKGSFEGAGIMVGLAFGWLAERRLVDFTTDPYYISTRERIMRGVVGVAIVGVTYLGGNFLFKLFLPYLWAKFFAMAVLVFMALFVAPLAFEAIGRRMRF